MMVDEFFNNAKCKMPPILNRMAGESEQSHRNRVRLYLLGCNQTRFTDIADIINPQNQFHRGFFTLYNECSAAREERANLTDSEASGRQMKCLIY